MHPFLVFVITSVLGGCGIHAAARAPGSPVIAPRPEGGPELAGQYLVILASKRDPSEPVPSLATIAAHPELALTPSTLLSSHYKNLMPCYTITYAAALPDLVRARERVNQLQALGVESYVKNAGTWVGPSTAIDTFCARKPGQASLDFALVQQEAAWIPVEVPETTEEALADSAPPARMVGSDRGAWEQPLAIRNAGDLSVGDAVPLVDIEGGDAFSCRVERFAFLTVGFPHWTILDAALPPSAPPCGEPRLMARVDCADPPPLLLRAEPGTLDVVPLGPEVTAPWAMSRLQEHPDGGPVPADWTRDVTVRSAGPWLLVQASIQDAMGLCGGTEFLLAGLFTVDGTPVFPIRRFEVAGVLGVVDVGRDGRPDLVIHSFPDVSQIVGADGSVLASQEVAYCDCPC